jgi:hypothetical protein
LLSGRRSKPQRERERERERDLRKNIFFYHFINGFGVGGQDRLK